MTDKNKFLLTGQFKGSSANVISLGASYVPQGSVVVTAGGVRLTEGSDYTVDYSAGEVTILNQSIIDAGTSVNVSLESNNDYGMQRKRMFGFNWEYDFSKNFQIGGTLQHLSEQALTSKVTMGSEPLKNTLWGLHVNWKTESQWLTNMLDKLPLLHCTQPSQITFTGEFAHLIAGTASGTQDNASYIDDFENAKSGISVLEPTMWVISSVPSMFPESRDKETVSSGYNRSLLAWYTIDPLFTYRSSSLTPSHIKSDIEQLSNHYVRAVYVNELYPNRDQSTYSGATNTLPVMNLAFYPQERGPYNLSTNVSYDGRLNNPADHWGGMMCKLNTTDDLPEGHLTAAISANHVGLGGGYAYNFVVGKHWLFHASATPSLIVWSGDKITINGERRYVDTKFPTVMLNERAAIVYFINPRHFLGANVVGSNLLKYNNITGMRQNKWLVRMFYGVRI